MGKKFGTNSKAEEGRARKAAQQEEVKTQKQREKEKLEEEKWKTGTKDISKKETDEAKRLEKLAKKQEKKSLEELEAKELEKYKPVKPAPKDNKALFSQPMIKKESAPSLPSTKLEAFSNGSSLDMYSASNIDDALFLLENANQSSNSVNIEKHPERRVKAAFVVFQERELPLLKEEFPTLRHTQLMERLHKLWQKSPDNPFNQAHIAHNASRSEEIEFSRDQVEQNLDRLKIK